jgi:hypothetical protein
MWTGVAVGTKCPPSKDVARGLPQLSGQELSERLPLGVQSQLRCSLAPREDLILIPHPPFSFPRDPCFSKWFFF